MAATNALGGYQMPGVAQGAYNPMAKAAQKKAGGGFFDNLGRAIQGIGATAGRAAGSATPAGGPQDVINDQNNTLSANGIDPRNPGGATPPPPPDYMGQYQSSLAQSRAAIAQQLQAALSDINGNQVRATQAINLLPGEYGQAYGAAQGALGGFAKTLDAHQAASGVGSQTGYSADWLAPEKAAMNNSLNFLNAQVPTLQLGAASEFNQRRGQANQAAMDANSALDQRYQDALLQQAQQQSGFSHDVEMEKMREAASGATQPQPGSAGYWAQQQQTNPSNTNALEGRAMASGFLPEFEKWSPAKQAQYIGSGAVSPNMQSFLQYIVATHSQQKAAPKKKTASKTGY